jgi:predicted  nucleic acid-binding Zn-ribbon protein
MKNRENVVASTNRRLDQLNEEHNELKEKTNKLEKDCQKSQIEYKNVCDNLDNTIANNKALTNKLKALEHNLRGT